MELVEAFNATVAAFGDALLFFLDPVFVGFMFGGLFLGIICGILPGIGSIVGISLFLPFVFFLTPREALPFIIGLASVTFIGGSITTILLGVPGTVGSTATLMDGFPMAKKGEADRALGAAINASAIGSVYTAAFAILMIPLVIPLVMATTSAEMVFIILLGITMIAVLSRGDMVKGLISGFLGLWVSLIGYDMIGGGHRYTFGSPYLYDGISVVAVTLGLFALPEMIRLIATGGTIAQQAAKLKGMKAAWRGVIDVFRHWKLNLGCSLIGWVIGVIPGVGSAVASWVSYGQAKQFSKHPELYGTGIVDGVIATESANDAREGGALLTTLALGIPGSTHMVLLLGAFILLGFEPGPPMLKYHLDLSLSMMLVIAVASVIAAVICLTLASSMARVAYVPGRILGPLVLAIVFIGTFIYKLRFFDIIVLVIFGGIGLVMDRFGYNKPAFILGVILGVMFEKYLFISLQAWGDQFFLRPACLALIVAIVAFVSFDSIKSWFERRFKRGGSKA